MLCCNLMFFASCSIENRINRDDYKELPIIFSVSFYDKLASIKSQYDTRVFTNSFVKQLTDIDNIDYSKPIQLNIIKNELFLKFQDNDKRKFILKFYGKLYNKKFVFYTNYETVSLPIIFITKNMERFTVYFPNENEIIFKKSRVDEGMLLFFGAGNSSNSEYKFKLLKNE